MNIYYVYAYLRKDGTPYYIGKGKKYRAWSKNHNVSVPRDRTKIVMLETNLTNIGACALERRYIKWYGRKDLGNGVLYNRTAGGEGVAGVKLSDQRKKQISDFWSNKPKPWASRPGELNTFYGKHHTSKTKERQSAIKQGDNNPMFGKKQNRVTCLVCRTETSVNALSVYHKH